VVPAQQRLDAGQALAVAAELRLVEQDELLLLQGMAQVAFQFQALQGAGVHVRLIELEVVFAALLGVVHGSVGVFHQLAEFVAVLRAQGNTNTGGHKKLAAFEHERFYQAGEDLLGHVDSPVQGLLAGGARLQEEGELVTAHARHGIVVTDAGQQADGHVLEHAVASGVAQGVVDRLETVKVEEHQHHPRLVTLCLLQRGVQAVLEQGAVGQVGQGVVIGQAVNALFTGLALADITEETHIARQIAFIIEHRRDADPGRVVFAVQALEPDFTLPSAMHMQLLEHIGQVRTLLGIDGEHAWQLVEHLRHGVAADPAEGFVGLHDIASGVSNEDGRGGVFKHRGGHAQVFFGAALLTHVAAYAQNPLKTIVLIPHQNQAQLDGHLVAVGAQAVEQKQLGLHLGAQGRQLLGLVQCGADALDQAVDPFQLLRGGDDRLPAIVEYPLRLIPQYGLYGRAQVVHAQRTVGRENHVADAFGQHPVALLAVTQ